MPSPDGAPSSDREPTDVLTSDDVARPRAVAIDDPAAPREMSDEALIEAWSDIVRIVEGTQSRVVGDIESTGVAPQWFSVLHLLSTAPGHRLPMSHIARDLTMTGGGFTKLADRMARDGLIDRRSSPGDRRIVNAALTPAGLELARSLGARYRSGLRTHVLGVLSADELHRLRDLAAKLAAGAADDAPASLATPRDPSLPDRRRPPQP